MDSAIRKELTGFDTMSAWMRRSRLHRKPQTETVRAALAIITMGKPVPAAGRTEAPNIIQYGGLAEPEGFEPSIRLYKRITV